MTSSNTLLGWETTTSTILVGLLPNQNFASAFLLVESYISNQGGWVPDSQTDPTGLGVPHNGQTPDQAAASIKANALSSTYDATLDITFTVQFQFLQKQTPNLDANSIITAMTQMAQNWIDEKITKNPKFPGAVVIYDSLAGTISGTGSVSPAQRIVIANDLAGSGKIIDYKEIALQFVLNRFHPNPMNGFWNVSEVYTEFDASLFVTIQHYTGNDFVTLDPAVPAKYLVGISPDTYAIISSISLPN